MKRMRKKTTAKKKTISIDKERHPKKHSDKERRRKKSSGEKLKDDFVKALKNNSDKIIETALKATILIVDMALKHDSPGDITKDTVELMNTLFLSKGIKKINEKNEQNIKETINQKSSTSQLVKVNDHKTSINNHKNNKTVKTSKKKTINKKDYENMELDFNKIKINPKLNGKIKMNTKLNGNIGKKKNGKSAILKKKRKREV